MDICDSRLSDCLWFVPGEGGKHLALYEFKCFSSCVNQSGRKRRRAKFPPLRLMLQVIHHGIELGRDSLDLRICACPSRDKKKKEERDVDSPLSGPSEGM